MNIVRTLIWMCVCTVSAIVGFFALALILPTSFTFSGSIAGVIAILATFGAIFGALTSGAN